MNTTKSPKRLLCPAKSQTRKDVGPAIVRGRAHAEERGRLREPQADLRGALAGRYHVEVIDLLEQPQLAKGDQILAVPTLVRKLPEPLKKIIGDLSNEERVLVGLDLRRGANLTIMKSFVHWYRSDDKLSSHRLARVGEGCGLER